VLDSAVIRQLAHRADARRSARTERSEHALVSAQSARVRLDQADSRPVLNLCANNYLGFANHPELIAAAQSALGEYGLGMASVRFICGTHRLHHDLERRLSVFLKMEDAILFSSAFDANAAIFEALLGEEDAIVSDALNHASIIDGIRLSKARRMPFEHGNMQALEEALRASLQCRIRVVVTDGVFSMDGDYAELKRICALADRYCALVVVDDSHATGFCGPGGRGTPSMFEVEGRVDIITGTFGKALGGASGGFVAGRSAVIDHLRQVARPYLFSNALMPAIAASTLRALDLIETDAAAIEDLWNNTRQLRSGLSDLGFRLLGGNHPIIPILIGEAGLARDMADGLIEAGVYVVAFAHPVVPVGEARIRVQATAAHTGEDLAFAIETFADVGAQCGLIPPRTNRHV
jgi:glycine C-acetyltransferase